MGRSSDKQHTMPIVDIHLSNPQIQLHSVTTGGSVILLLKKATATGRYLSNLFWKDGERSWPTSDELLRKKEFEYTLDKVRIYAFRPDMDNFYGLQWLEFDTSGQNQDNQEWSNSKLRRFRPLSLHLPSLDNFHQIMTECAFHVFQETYLSPFNLTEQELLDFQFRGCIKPANKDMADHFYLQINELTFDLDSHQFQTLLDLVRNVLLVPQPINKNKGKYTICNEHNDEHDSENHSKVEQSGDTGTDIDNHDEGTTTSATPKLQHIHDTVPHSNPLTKKDREALKAFSRNLLDSTTLDISKPMQHVHWRLGIARYTIRTNKNTTNSVQMTLFELCGNHAFTSTGAISSRIDLENLAIQDLEPGPDCLKFHNPSKVLSSTLKEKTICECCGCEYDRDKNVGSEVSCPKMPMKGYPHTSKQRMITLRVDSMPNLVEGLTLYERFEIAIYPSVEYTLIVQITRSLGDLLFDYFVGDKQDDPNADDHALHNGIDDPTDSNRRNTNSGNEQIHKQPPSKDKRKISMESLPVPVPAPGKPKPPEIIFFKNLRLGHINARLSFAGFPVAPDTNELGISVPAYSKAYQVGPASYHSRKYLTKHLIQEVLKSGTTSVTRQIFSHNANANDNQEPNQHKSPDANTKHSSPLPTTDKQDANRILFGYQKEKSKKKKFIYRFRRK